MHAKKNALPLLSEPEPSNSRQDKQNTVLLEKWVAMTSISK